MGAVVANDDSFLDELLDASLSMVDKVPPADLPMNIKDATETVTEVFASKNVTSEGAHIEFPYSSSALEHIATHLNNQNQAAKHAQMECQSLFLSLYFQNRH